MSSRRCCCGGFSAESTAVQSPKSPPRTRSQARLSLDLAQLLRPARSALAPVCRQERDFVAAAAGHGFVFDNSDGARRSVLRLLRLPCRAFCFVYKQHACVIKKQRHKCFGIATWYSVSSGLADCPTICCPGQGAFFIRIDFEPERPLGILRAAFSV
jgi:hypothetical protein